MKYTFLLVCLLLLTSCSKKESNDNCNFLFNAAVNVDVDLNLPYYSELQFVSISRYIPNQGNAGIIVTNTGNGVLRAWDASDPNHTPSTCSTLDIVGAEAVCGCADENTYSLFTGQSLGDLVYHVA